MLEEKDIFFYFFKDQVIFEEEEILIKVGGIYIVFMFYSKIWKEKLKEKMDIVEIDGEEQDIFFYFKFYLIEKYMDNFCVIDDELFFLKLEDMDFELLSIFILLDSVKCGLIKNYDKIRNFFVKEGIIWLGIYFWFGIISICEKVYCVSQLNEIFFNELIWRDFYSQILVNFFKVVNESF